MYQQCRLVGIFYAFLCPIICLFYFLCLILLDRKHLHIEIDISCLYRAGQRQATVRRVDVLQAGSSVPPSHPQTIHLPSDFGHHKPSTVDQRSLQSIQRCRWLEHTSRHSIQLSAKQTITEKTWLFIKISRIIIIIIIYLLIKVYKIHKCNKTSKTEQDSKTH